MFFSAVLLHLFQRIIGAAKAISPRVINKTFLSTLSWLLASQCTISAGCGYQTGLEICGASGCKRLFPSFQCKKSLHRPPSGKMEPNLFNRESVEETVVISLAAECLYWAAVSPRLACLGQARPVRVCAGNGGRRNPRPRKKAAGHRQRPLRSGQPLHRPESGILPQTPPLCSGCSESCGVQPTPLGQVPITWGCGPDGRVYPYSNHKVRPGRPTGARFGALACSGCTVRTP